MNIMQCHVVLKEYEKGTASAGKNRQYFEVHKSVGNAGGGASDSGRWRCFWVRRALFGILRNS